MKNKPQVRLSGGEDLFKDCALSTRRGLYEESFAFSRCYRWKTSNLRFRIRGNEDLKVPTLLLKWRHFSFNFISNLPESYEYSCTLSDNSNLGWKENLVSPLAKHVNVHQDKLIIIQVNTYNIVSDVRVHMKLCCISSSLSCI